MNLKNENSDIPERPGFAVAGLTISIISALLVLFTCTIPFMILIIPPLAVAFIGLVGLILSVIGLRSPGKRKLAIAGIVLSSLIIFGMLFIQIVVLSVSSG